MKAKILKTGQIVDLAYCKDNLYEKGCYYDGGDLEIVMNFFSPNSITPPQFELLETTDNADMVNVLREMCGRLKDMAEYFNRQA